MERVVCDRNNKQENNKQESNEVPAEDVSTSLNEIVAETDPKTSEKPVDISTGNVNTEMSMDVQEDQGRKGLCPTESDSDTKIPTRRSKYYPVPNVEIARQRDKSTAKKQSASS